MRQRLILQHDRLLDRREELSIRIRTLRALLEKDEIKGAALSVIIGEWRSLLREDRDLEAQATEALDQLYELGLSDPSEPIQLAA